MILWQLLILWLVLKVFPTNNDTVATAGIMATADFVAMADGVPD
jgi:hypothetical protein